MQKETKIRLTIIALAVTVIVIALRGRKNNTTKNGAGHTATNMGEIKVWDKVSADRIKTLHPLVRKKATEFVNEAEKQGIKLRVTSGYRTYAEQTALYNQGRTTAGGIVTNAKAGSSSHNFGTAIDVVQIVDGKAMWNGDWEKIAKIGKSLGFSWGGDWKSFKDKPHFEMNFGRSMAEMRKLKQDGKVIDDYIDFSA